MANCGTEVLCIMLFYDGAELARIVNKVLGNIFLFHDPFVLKVLRVFVWKLW